MKDIDWGYLFGMALQSVPEPRKVARDVFAFQPPRNVLWMILALILVSLTFLGVISSILFPVSVDEVGNLLADPMMTGVVQASSAVLTAFGIYWIGRAAGGTGSFDQALLTVIWIHFVLLILQIGVLGLAIFAPGLAVLLMVMSLVMMFWLLSHFVAEMHGFRSAGVVFVGILMVLLVITVVLSLILAILGISFGIEPGAGSGGA